MPNAFKNAKYYNLVKTKLLNPININKYIGYVVDNNFKVDTNFMLDPTPNVFNPNNFRIDKMLHTIYNLINYINLKCVSPTKADYNTLYRVLSNNTYNIRTMLISALTNAYFINYVVMPISKKLAINKIKRNSIYNLGLGLKLSIKAFKDDFN